jgi:hypothetical protein
MPPKSVPLTWRNVSAPSGAGALNAFNRSSENLGNAISGIGDALKTGSQDFADAETQEFLTELNAERDPAIRQEMIQASQAFLDYGQVNAAQKTNLLEDRAIAAEGRAVTKEARDALVGIERTEAHESDLLTDELKRTFDAEDEIRRQEKATRDQALHPLDLAAKRAQRINSETSTANTRLDITAKQKVLNDTKTVSDQLQSIESLRGTPGYAAQLNNLIQSNKTKGVKDPDKRLQAAANQELDSTPVEVAESVFASAGLTGNAKDYSVHSYKKLHTQVVEKLRAAHPHVDIKTLRAKAADAINSTEHGIRFSDQQKYEAKTKAERRVIDNQVKMDEFATDLVNSRGTGAFTATLATATEYALTNGITTAQRDRLIPFMELALANESLNPEDTMLSTLGKTRLTAKSSDYGPGNKKKYINTERKRLQKKYPYVSEKVIDAKITQAIQRDGTLSTKFATGAAPAQLRADLDKAAAKQVLDTAVKRNIAIVDMGENPTKHILGILTPKFAAQGRSDSVDPKKLSRVVNNAITKWQGYFSTEDLTVQGRNALNLAIRDTLSNIEVDVDRADINDYALPGVNDTEDADQISKREALAELLKHLPKKSKTVSPSILTKAIKKHLGIQ